MPIGTERRKFAYLSQKEKLLKNRVGRMFQLLPVFAGGYVEKIATNYAIIKTLALEGPAHSYEIWKRVNRDPLINSFEHGPSYRKIDRLLSELKYEHGYVKVVKTEDFNVGKKEIFGLTYKGLTVAESIPDVRSNYEKTVRWEVVEGGEIRERSDKSMSAIAAFINQGQKEKAMALRVFEAFNWELLARRDFDTLSEQQVSTMRDKIYRNTFFNYIQKAGENAGDPNLKLLTSWLASLKQKNPELHEWFEGFKREMRQNNKEQEDFLDRI